MTEDSIDPDQLDLFEQHLLDNPKEGCRLCEYDTSLCDCGAYEEEER